MWNLFRCIIKKFKRRKEFDARVAVVTRELNRKGGASDGIY